MAKHTPRKDSVFLKCAGKPDPPAKEGNQTLIHTGHKTNSEWAEDINLRPDTVNLLAGNTRKRARTVWGMTLGTRKLRQKKQNEADRIASNDEAPAQRRRPWAE